MNKFVQLSTDIAKLWDKYAATYLNGMANTIEIAVLATAIGCIIGLLCGVLQTIPCVKTDNPIKRAVLFLIRGIVRVYVEVFRGTPMILQAVTIYYALPYFTDNSMKFTNIWIATLLVVSINTGAYMAESVRGGIISIDPGQTEGAKAIGMTHWQTMVHVVLPQAFRNIMPQIGNNLIINIKDTSVMSIIGFTDFFAVHKTVTGATFKYFPSAAIEMVGYLTMTVLASVILRMVEKKMEGDNSYELVQEDVLTMSAGTYRNPVKPEDLLERNLEHERGK